VSEFNEYQIAVGGYKDGEQVMSQRVLKISPELRKDAVAFESYLAHLVSKMIKEIDESGAEEVA
jgi:hypothetical protein